tara:strand:+ start:8005 stop:8259 length:255 start_codon:yes stop_codon:yes gene_type:complete
MYIITEPGGIMKITRQQLRDIILQESLSDKEVTIILQVEENKNLILSLSKKLESERAHNSNVVDALMEEIQTLRDEIEDLKSRV